jgi:hypothetical protein
MIEIFDNGNARVYWQDSHVDVNLREIHSNAIEAWLQQDE